MKLKFLSDIQSVSLIVVIKLFNYVLAAVIIFYQVTIMPHSECVSRYGRGFVTDRMLCASTTSKGLCQTHSGGPLVVRRPDGSYSLAGILSAGMRCSTRDSVGLFTNMSAMYDWLHNNMVPEDSVPQLISSLP